MGARHRCPTRSQPIIAGFSVSPTHSHLRGCQAIRQQIRHHASGLCARLCLTLTGCDFVCVRPAAAPCQGMRLPRPLPANCAAQMSMPWKLPWPNPAFLHSTCLVKSRETWSTCGLVSTGQSINLVTNTVTALLGLSIHSMTAGRLAGQS